MCAFRIKSPAFKCSLSSTVSLARIPFVIMDSDSDHESDTMSLASGPPPSESHYSMASSQTSYDFDPSIRSASPSVFSMTSSLRSNLYRQEYGRGLNNYSDIYRLPADDEELQRLGMSGASCNLKMVAHLNCTAPR